MEFTNVVSTGGEGRIPRTQSRACLHARQAFCHWARLPTTLELSWSCQVYCFWKSDLFPKYLASLFLPTRQQGCCYWKPGTLCHSHSPSLQPFCILADICMSETHKLRACFEIRPWFESRLSGLIDLDRSGKDNPLYVKRSAGSCGCSESLKWETESAALSTCSGKESLDSSRLDWDYRLALTQRPLEEVMSSPELEAFKAEAPSGAQSGQTSALYSQQSNLCGVAELGLGICGPMCVKSTS